MVTSRVVIDARMVGEHGHGFARYVSLMAKGLRQIHSAEKLKYELHFLVSTEKFEKEGFYGFPTTRVFAPFLSARELFEIPRVLRKLNAQVYHSPTFSSLIYPVVPTIQTIHDLNHLYFGGIIEKIYYKFLLKPFARLSHRLLTVSRFSQAEISEWLGVERGQIQVVSNAIDPSFIHTKLDSEAEILSRYNVEAKGYFFCLSNPKPHKNLRFLCAAYEKSEKKFPLLLSVSESLSPDAKSIGALGDAEVSVLLKNARAVFFPSLYEGFGLPPVEAAAFGTAVFVSDIPPHQEALAPLQGEGVKFLPLEVLRLWTEAFDQSSAEAPVAPSSQARARLLDAWSVEKLAQNMHRIYSEMC